MALYRQQKTQQISTLPQRDRKEERRGKQLKSRKREDEDEEED
jgi:hypothetical protein